MVMNPENENVTPHNKAKTVYAKEKKKDRNIKESWQGKTSSLSFKKDLKKKQKTGVLQKL